MKYTPQEALRLYNSEWPALNAKKEAAVAMGDAALTKVCRQHLSQLSQKYADRFYYTVEEPSLLESQIADWLEGLGANEDASDIAQAFVDKLGVSHDLATRMLTVLCKTK